MLLHKLNATLWKCMKIRQRHYMLTIFVFSIPILLYGLLAWGRMKIGHISKQYVNESTYAPQISEEMLYAHYKVDIPNTFLLYAPATEFTDELMRSVQMKMEILNEKFVGFVSDDDLLAFYNKNTTDHTVYAVVFDGIAQDRIPDSLNYSIRNYEKYIDWQTDLRWNTLLNNYVPGAGSEKYFHKAFLNLQLVIDKTYLSMKTNKGLDMFFSFQEFPYPPHYSDTGLQDLFMIMLPLVTLFSTIFIFPGTLKRMMEEKQTGIKELMKMMGLPPSIMYLSWFIDALLPVVLSTIVCTLFMKVTWGTDYPPIEYCNGFIFGLFLLLYFSSCIAFCLFVATLSDSPSITTTFAILIWIITYILPFSWKNMANFGFGLNMVASLIPNIAMYNGFHAISLYEAQGIGVQWSNFFSSANGGLNTISLGHASIMLLVDILLLMVIGFYVDQVRPGNFGLPKPWNFPIMYVTNYFKNVNKKRKSSVGIDVDAFCDETVKIEECNLTPGIDIIDMTKRYGDKVAVRNLSVKFYNGEIAVLLGKNGAGKTTTMSVLTGMINASEGDVRINGEDICENLDYVRSIMGICPQHDLLFPELTVLEHILFFAKLNNVRNPQSKVLHLLKELGIFEQRGKLPSEISGGMKRKLCLGMAIISNPKVLILDEPTSGLDPKSRRDIWDLLLNWRSDNPNTTILVSTHFMEEADVLGDRITIIEKGKLMAQGSPMFLKSAYGNKCILTLILKEDADDSLINSFRTFPHVVHIARKDTIYTLTLDQDKASLIKLLNLIEESNAVQNVGISISTMEEVFLKLANFDTFVRTDDTDNGNTTKILMRTTSTAASTSSETSREKLMSYVQIQRYGGYIYNARRYFPYVLMACAMMILLTFVGSTQSVGRVSRPELKLQLNAYGKTKVFYSVDPKIPNNFADEFQKLVKAQGSEPIKVPSVSDALIALGLSNFDEYKQRTVVAIEFNATENSQDVLINMMYSNNALHGAPIILNLATNVVAATLSGPRINAANVPLKTNSEVAIEELASEVQIVILWVILVPIALLFLVSSYMNYPLIERVSNFKHLVYMSGVKTYWYWLQMFQFHFVVLYLPSILILVLIVYINPMYHQGTGALLTLFICYGFMMIPCVFVFSYKKSVAAAVGSLAILTIFSGIVLTFVVMILRNIGDPTYEKWGVVLHVVSHASPQYWLTSNLIAFSRKSVWQYQWDHMQPQVKAITCKFTLNPCCPINGEVDTEACKAYKNFFVDGLAPGYLILVTSLCFFSYGLILCLIDSLRVRRFIRYGYRKLTLGGNYKTLDEKHNEGSDGSQAERGAGDQIEGDDKASFTAENLKMTFANKDAVKDLSFSVQPGQCYGLLGVNGAGKTTTFNMLTGYAMPTSGNATIKRNNRTCSLNHDGETYLKEIGYCPQFNALNDVLSARVLLRLFGGYRGLEGEKLEKEVDELIGMLALDGFANVPSGNLSGGNKRKLCLGISLIGDPAVNFLDEPTTGVDPVSRRMIWDVLKQVKEKKALVLTSHSMDECEILCDELAIMKRGEVYTKGKIDELKVKHGQGLTIKIKLKENLSTSRDVTDVGGSSSVSNDTKHLEIQNLDNITADLSKMCPRIELKDKHEGLLHFFLPNPNCESKDLKEYLINLENMKKQYNFVDYTINTSTLEDVFLIVARQSEADEEDTRDVIV